MRTCVYRKNVEVRVAHAQEVHVGACTHAQKERGSAGAIWRNCEKARARVQVRVQIGNQHYCAARNHLHEDLSTLCTITTTLIKASYQIDISDKAG